MTAQPGPSLESPAPTHGGSKPTPREFDSGLETAELPEPPAPKGLQWIGVVGPGVIVLGLSIGSGEFLLGPAAFVKHGLALLWVCSVSVLLQTVFNVEAMRYTLATGEPVLNGFMRTRPGPALWLWLYAALFLLQAGWPAWAGNAAGALFYVAHDRLPLASDAASVQKIGVLAYLACFALLSFGRGIERTLEILNWIMVVCILGTFAVMAICWVSPSVWWQAACGYVGFDPLGTRFELLPQGADYFLLGAFAAYSGAGGMFNLTLTNWARDKGYGMGQVAGFIPSAIGGAKVALSSRGFRFPIHETSLRRWCGWRRIVRVDQWGVFCIGALLGMGLPALLYVEFMPRGRDLRDLGIAAALAEGIAARVGARAAFVVALMGAWVLFKTQLDILEGMTRTLTDLVWSTSRRVREYCRADVRLLYYGLLALLVLWGVAALRISKPIKMLQMGATFAALVFVITPLHLLRLNTSRLPYPLRPGIWPRICLVLMSAYYGTFAALSFMSLLSK